MPDGYQLGLKTARWASREAKLGPINRGTSGRMPETFRESPDAKIFRNDSGEEVPAYGCMKVTDAETDATTGRYVLVIDKPSNTGGPFVFNGPRAVAIGGYGQAYSGVVKGTVGTGTPAAGETWGPTSNWVLGSSGDAAILVYGMIETDIVLGSSIVTPSAGRLRCRLSSALTLTQASKASCPVVRSLDGRSYPSTVTLSNVPSVITGNYIHAGPIDAIAIVTYDPRTGLYWIDGLECEVA